MPPAPRPQWQQATALITIGAGSVATGLSFVPRAAADLTTPASIPPVTLLALEHANAPAPGKDAMLRAAIVHIARHFLRLAETRSPAEMEAMIWQYASTDGANHGPSCGAFASLTLELGSHIAGVDSWVTGGSSYPWPVHSWVDGRVDPNPASPGVVSILQDARSHGRWHPLGDGYAPQPGDWVLFDGHVEVVTKYHGGVLHTIGGDSLPNLSVNAHEYPAPLQAQGVEGFVDNGLGMSKAAGGATHAGGGGRHGGRAAAKAGSPTAPAPMASADPVPSAGPVAAADPVPGGAATSSAAPRGAAGGSASSGGAASAGAASGDAASGGVASSAGPVTTADATAQQPELAPRAIPAPRTVPHARYAQASRALAAQGAMPTAPGGHASGAGAAARASRVAAEPQQHSRYGTGSPASGTGRAARPAGQRSQHAGRSPQHGDQPAGRTGRSPQHTDRSRAMTADVPATGLRPARPHHARPGEAAIPGLFKGVHRHHQVDGGTLAPYHRHDAPPSNAPLPGTAAQQAFINEVASGAMATQRKYGVPASVTIAQAIDESAWGQSVLATNDHNLFGIKGTGPAGSDELPTQEVINGQVVNLSASFQIYQNTAQSIDAHGRLLAHSGDYAGAMAQRKDPNAFADALTGVYATDPSYGAKLVQLMQQYDLYRFDRAAAHGPGPGTGGAPAAPHHPSRTDRGSGARQRGGAQHPAATPLPPSAPGARRPAPGRDRTPDPRQPGPVGNPVPVQPAPIAEPVPGQPAPIANPVPMEPGPRTGPRSRPHDAKPARAAKAGATGAGGQGDSPSLGLVRGNAQAIHQDAGTRPAAVLYPGRSSRPGPLAHPARPTDLARPSGRGAATGSVTATGQDPATGSAAASGSATTTAPAAAAGQASATGQGAGNLLGMGTWPNSGAVAGQAHNSADAAIPGVPHALTPMTGRAHTRRPIGRLRPAHPARRPTLPASPGPHPGTTAAGSSANGHADARRGAAPAGQPAGSGPSAAPTLHRTVPPATTPAVSRTGGAIIPGLQHQGRWAHAAPAVSDGTPPADGARMAAGQPGGSSPASAGPRPAGANPAPASARPRSQDANAVPAPASPVPAPASPVPAPASPVPAPAYPGAAAANPMPTGAVGPAQGGADVPGLGHAAQATAPARQMAAANGGAAASAATPGNTSWAPGRSPRTGPAPGASTGATLTVYRAHMPPSVRQAFLTSAKLPLVRAEPLYRDVASHTGIRWEILAACDWMQCKARHGYSPVYGEKLGTLNPDDTCYRTKSAALEQCASDLVQLARSVYQLDIATSRELSIRDLASVFAAFRWGGLLRQHCTSAMDFPYSVAGLTADHTHMRWPNIDEPNAPDKPGSRFRQPFGAVPVVLSLNYQALM